MVETVTLWTSFHYQPEAQHPKICSYPQAAGRLPHLLVGSWNLTMGEASELATLNPSFARAEQARAAPIPLGLRPPPSPERAQPTPICPRSF
jgi:hypothetical protein